VKYIVRVTECLPQAPPCCPVGSELHCHSQLFIRLHIHSLSITVQPPGPVTSLYVYYGVPPSPGRMIDVLGEDRGGTCARLLLQSRLEGAEASPPDSDCESVSRHKRNNNTRWLLCIRHLQRQVESSARAALEHLHWRFYRERSCTRSTFNQIIGAFNVQACFFFFFFSSSSSSFFPTLALQEWLKRFRSDFT